MKRKLGTVVAITSFALLVGTGVLWWRSLFVADEFGHLAPVVVNGWYGRREWIVLSGAGFFEVGRTIETTFDSAGDAQVRAIDRTARFGWYAAPGVDDFGDDRPLDVWRAGLTRLAWYPSHHRGRWLDSSGRFLEVPWAMPFVALMVPPVIALYRRRRRRRKLVGFALT